MVKILFVDASFGQGTVAFFDGKEALLQHFEAGFGGSNAIAHLVAPLPTPDIIAYGEGPGSYTGLRASCAFALGLSISLNKPLVAVPLMASFPETCILDAKSGGLWAFIEGKAQKMSIDTALEKLPKTLFSPQSELLSKRLGRTVHHGEPDWIRLKKMIEQKTPCNTISLNYV